MSERWLKVVREGSADVARLYAAERFRTRAIVDLLWLDAFEGGPWTPSAIQQLAVTTWTDDVLIYTRATDEEVERSEVDTSLPATRLLRQ